MWLPCEFEHFLLSLENLLGNIRNQDPAFTILLNDFNARSKSWWVHDITNNDGTQTESISSLYGFSQLISEPTHNLQNSSSSIDLIFTDQPNLVINSGIKPSLHENCHHQITYTKFSLQIIYPPLYQRLVWDYQNANANSIQKALNVIDWNKLFTNANAKKQLNILNDTLFNIFSKFPRSKVIIIDDRDPLWTNEEIKCNIKSKNKKFQQYLRNGGKITDFELWISKQQNWLKWYKIGKKSVFWLIIETE